MKINIAIDGPGAAGKSTIAKCLAKKLNYVHLDTGAMYRSTAYKALQNHICLEDEEAVCKMLEHTKIQLLIDGSILLDGEDVSDKIRTNEISLAASLVSKLANVRRMLVARQQEMAKEKGFIMDGRDIASVVLPNADVKIFLTASVEERARRRVLDFENQGLTNVDYEKVKEEIKARDYQDENRDIAPLIKVDSAILLDTTSLTIDQVVDEMIKLIKYKENF